MKNNIEFVNVLEDCFTLWEYCKENNFTDSDYEDFYQSGGDLQFFEGDPDIIKVHGETGFFPFVVTSVFIGLMIGNTRRKQF